MCVLLAGSGDVAPTPTPTPTPGETFVAVAPCDVPIVWRPLADLTSIRFEIEERAKPELLGIGEGANTVMVNLRARAECLARSIVAAYGPNVE